jgi:hypothetical protein
LLDHAVRRPALAVRQQHRRLACMRCGGWAMRQVRLCVLETVERARRYRDAKVANQTVLGL